MCATSTHFSGGNGGYTVSIKCGSVTTTFDIYNGADGSGGGGGGKDGASCAATVTTLYETNNAGVATDVVSGHRVSIKCGTDPASSFDIMNCSECEDGDDEDGISCSASTTSIAATDVSPAGTRVTITCGKKSTSFDVLDGSDGADGGGGSGGTGAKGDSCSASTTTIAATVDSPAGTRVSIKCGTNAAKTSMFMTAMMETTATTATTATTVNRAAQHQRASTRLRASLRAIV